MEDRLKKTLRAISLETRHILEGQNGEAGDLEQQLNRLGIWRNRSKPIEEMPHLSTEDREGRWVVDAYIDFRQEAGVTREDAVAEFIRESAYTWANRLFALRIMEARGIIDEIIQQKEVYGWRSLVHNRFAKMNPEACRGEDNGLFKVLFNEFQERSKALPDLFNLEASATKLRPSVAALKRILVLMSCQRNATDAAFEAPDCFGWMYQYWNEEERKKVLDLAKSAKIEGNDIIPYTQLYTEQYMVKFLVQNSLGATWMEMHPESKLFEGWPYFVKSAILAPVESKSISEITFLDPACGSAHFHIEAFDLFYDMYIEEGVIKDPIEICSSILNNNLFGIDIDERAIQIARAVLFMKAVERAPGLESIDLTDFNEHIIAANTKLSKRTEHLKAFLKKHPDDAPFIDALDVVFKGLENVDELGSLVQIEEPIKKEFEVLRKKGSLSIIGKDACCNACENSLILRLKEHFISEGFTSDPVGSFFGKSVGKGLSISDLLSRKYDIVAANPPYMGSNNMGSTLKSYLSNNYNSAKRDLYAAFLFRSTQLCSNNGKIALLTLHTFLTSRAFKDLRREILNSAVFRTFAHLGTGTMKSLSNPNAQGFCMYVIETLKKSKTNIKNDGIFIRLIDCEDKDLALTEVLNSNLDQNGRVFLRKSSSFAKLKESQIIYWVTDGILDLLASDNTLGKIARVPKGLSTGDNNRFLRFHWETPNSVHWVAYAKGGGYKKWHGLQWYSLNWSNNGFLIKNLQDATGYIRSRVQNEKYYRKKGFTYTEVANSSFGVRNLSETEFFDARSPGIFMNQDMDMPLGLLAILNCRISTFLFRCISPGVMLDQAYAPDLPIPNNYDSSELNLLTEYVYNIKRELCCFNLEERIFRGFYPHMNSLHSIDLLYLTEAILLTIEGIIEELTIKLYSLSENDIETILKETGKPCGWNDIIMDYDNVSIVTTESLGYFNNTILKALSNRKSISLSTCEIQDLRKQICSLFKAGPGAKIGNNEEMVSSENDINEAVSLGAQIPIPSETFLEEMAQKLHIHPISAYWLLKEGVEQEGWRCIPEEQRMAKDWFSVTILRLLGHRWPKQIEPGEPLPDWADKDGIVPLTEGCGERTLLDRVRERIAEEFPGGRVQDIEREFEEIMGVNLEKWLAGSFFKHHISQFKKRPIAWQIESKPTNGSGRGRKAKQVPIFSCLVYYHKLNGDLLHKIRTQYVWDMRDRFQTEMRTLENMASPSNVQLERLGNLRRWIEELKDFDDKLDEVSLNGFDCTMLKEIINQEPLDKWTSRDGQVAPLATKEEFYLQEKRYDPDINDGVRVNVAPLQIAGLLSADVLAKKDLEKVIRDRAEWRADERRWCRQSKLSRPGWWKVDVQ